MEIYIQEHKQKIVMLKLRCYDITMQDKTQEWLLRIKLESPIEIHEQHFLVVLPNRSFINLQGKANQIPRPNQGDRPKNKHRAIPADVSVKNSRI